MANQSSSGKSHRINAFDFLLIILVVGVISIAVINVIRANPNKISSANKEAHYTITTEALPKSVLEQVAIGDYVYDSETGQVIGKVSAVTSEEYALIGENALGETVKTPIEDKIILTVTVNSPIWTNSSSYTIDGYRIAVGKTMSIRTAPASEDSEKGIAVVGECKSITISDKLN
jgi:hypothetical protein